MDEESGRRRRNDAPADNQFETSNGDGASASKPYYQRRGHHHHDGGGDRHADDRSLFRADDVATPSAARRRSSVDADGPSASIGAGAALPTNAPGGAALDGGDPGGIAGVEPDDDHDMELLWREFEDDTTLPPGLLEFFDVEPSAPAAAAPLPAWAPPYMDGNAARSAAFDHVNNLAAAEAASRYLVGQHQSAAPPLSSSSSVRSGAGAGASHADGNARDGDGGYGGHDRAEAQRPSSPARPATDTDRHLEKLKRSEWSYTAVLLTAELVGIGLLTIPTVYATLGWFVGVLVTLLASAVSTITGYLIQLIKVRHPRIINWNVAARQILRSRTASRLFAVMYVVQHVVMIGGFGLSVAIAIGSIAGGAGCFVVYALVGVLAPWILAQRRTLRGTRVLVYITFVSILVAIAFPVLEAIFTRADFSGTITAVNTTSSWYESMTVTLTLLFSFTGHVAYFAIVSEMKEPREFIKSNLSSQIFGTLLYITVGVLSYAHYGPEVKSPVLLSVQNEGARITSMVMLIISVVGSASLFIISLNFYVMPKAFGVRVLLEKNVRARAMYAAVSAAEMAVAFVLICVTPFFNEFLSLEASLTGVVFTYMAPNVLYLADRGWRKCWIEASARRRAATAGMLSIVAAFCYVSVGGVVASIIGIVVQYQNGRYTRPFSCNVSALL